MTSSLGLINLLEWLIGPRETFHLLDHWFILEGYNSETAGRDVLGKVQRKGCRASMLSPGMPFSPNLHVFTQNFSEPGPFGFLGRPHYKGMMIKSLAIHDQFSLQLLPHPGR